MARRTKIKTIHAWLGIDPGKKGAITLIDEHGGLQFFPWPKDDDLREIRDILIKWKREYIIKGCLLEKVHAMPGQGVTSMFSFGTNFGCWIMALAFADIPYELITPQKWQKAVTYPKDGATPNARALTAVRRLFPKETFILPRCRVPHDGLVDAALMSVVAKRKFQ
jgi:crossover junction endodeoxyribonuclease RuvC